MAVARKMYSRNSPSPAERRTHSDSHGSQTVNPLPSPSGIQRFPSASINNETFMQIDDSWPKNDPKRRWRPFSLIVRQVRWLRRHWVMSIVGLFVAVVLVVGVTVAIVVPLTSSSADSVADFSDDPTLMSPTASTEAFTRGSFAGGTIQSVNFKNLSGLQSLRADARHSGGYIFTLRSRIVIVSQDAFSEEASAENFTEIRWELHSDCARCDVFDVEENCRSSSNVCTEESFVYCCDGCTSGESFCSVRGEQLHYTGHFLDGDFHYKEGNGSLIISITYSDAKDACFLQQFDVEISERVSIAPFRPMSCDILWVDRTRVQYSAVASVDAGLISWQGSLTDDGFVYLYSSCGTFHSVGGSVTGKEAKLLMQPYQGYVIVVDITSEGLMTVIRVDNSSFAVAVPRSLSFEFPGSFGDALILAGKLVFWHYSDEVVYIAKINFEWEGH